MKIDNIFYLKGFVGQDPDLKETKNNNKVVNLSIGENISNKEGETRTNWHRATAWDRTAEYISENIKKGMLVRIEGRNVPRLLEIEGKKYPTNELVINSIEQISYNKKQEEPAIEESDIPADMGI